MEGDPSNAQRRLAGVHFFLAALYPVHMHRGHLLLALALFLPACSTAWIAAGGAVVGIYVWERTTDLQYESLTPSSAESVFAAAVEVLQERGGSGVEIWHGSLRIQAQVEGAEVEVRVSQEGPSHARIVIEASKGYLGKPQLAEDLALEILRRVGPAG